MIKTSTFIAAPTLAASGSAFAQGTPPNTSWPNPSTAAGTQNPAGGPMGTTGTIPRATPARPTGDATSGEVQHISLHEEGDALLIELLTLRTPGAGRVLLQELELEMKPGDGLPIIRPSGSGKSSLLRAIAGLRDHGSGTVRRLPLQRLMFLPQRPYMPAGSLRQQLLYPSRDIESVTDERLTGILAEVQLPDLVARVGGLEAVQHWDKILRTGEQQRLSFARVLVHTPRFFILDEATSALDDENEAALYARVKKEGATLISIAYREAVVPFHTQVLRFGGDGRWGLQQADAHIAARRSKAARDVEASA